MGSPRSGSSLPEHLKYPKAEEGKEFIPLVIKAVVFASLQNPEEQEATESESPYHNEERINNLSSMIMTAERKCYDR